MSLGSFSEKQLRPTWPKTLSWTRPLVAVSFLQVVPTLRVVVVGGELQVLKGKDTSQTGMLAVVSLSRPFCLPALVALGKEKSQDRKGRTVLLSTYIQ